MADFRVIPSIEQLRQRPAVRSLETQYGHEALVQALRDAAAGFRTRLTEGGGAPPSEETAADTIARDAERRLAQGFEPSLQSVINATGVIIHTNLGRAPIAHAALERIAALAAGYTNLEYDVSTGARGSRAVHAEALLARI